MCVRDVQGEFIYLLKARFCTSAVDAMRMRRFKEAAEAEVRAARSSFQALAAGRALLMRRSTTASATVSSSSLHC